MSKRKLDKIFRPKKIAVIGASSKKGSVGYALMKNLIGSGYDGIVYPINPKHDNIQGVRAYPTVNSIPDKIDLAIIATPAKTIPKLIEDCGKSGIEGIVIISSGFKEAGKEGRILYNQIKKLSKEYGIRIIGPNCLGFIKPSLNLNATFAGKGALPGKIAFISQSGALGTAILDWAAEHHVGFSYFVSIGSMLDVGFSDLIDYFGDNPETESILIYMESLTNARKFLSAARAFARTKPIVVIKVGRSIEGAKAAMSHTGSLAGNDAVFDAAFKRAGIIRVNNINELFDCAQTLAKQKRPLSNRLCIVTNAGGPGVIATDSLISQGGKLAKLSNRSIKELNKILPPFWSKSNPLDILGDADPNRYRKALEICIQDDNVDGILIILTPQAMTDPTKVAKEIASLPNRENKTILAAWMGESEVEEGANILKKNNIPVYHTPEEAVRSFNLMYQYEKNLRMIYETPATIPHAFKPRTKKNKKLIGDVYKEGRVNLTELEAKELLKNYGIPVGRSYIAKTANQAAIISAKIGFPVVMKILSPDILHKTEIKGVKVNIKSSNDARKCFNDIIKSAKKVYPKADIHGVLIEKMVEKKYELLIGCKKDPIFGPAIVFGMGGIAVEVFKDTNVGLPPLNMALSMRLIEETKIYNLLKGYRGMNGVDITSIQFLLYKFAYLVSDFPQIKEIDINPFAVDSKGGVVLDAKVILDEKLKDKKIDPYSHLVISPYPKEFIKRVKLKDGSMAVLRPIRPEDEPMEKEMFMNFSEETQRFRFFTPIKNITHEILTRFTQIDYDREISIIAEIKKKGKKHMAGFVRLVTDPYSKSAEFAIVIADPWHHLGIGNKLTDYILEIAKKRGIKMIYANILHDNHIMLHMLRKRGFKILKKETTYYGELDLKKEEVKIK